MFKTAATNNFVEMPAEKRQVSDLGCVQIHPCIFESRGNATQKDLRSLISQDPG